MNKRTVMVVLECSTDTDTDEFDTVSAWDKVVPALGVRQVMVCVAQPTDPEE